MNLRVVSTLAVCRHDPYWLVQAGYHALIVKCMCDKRDNFQGQASSSIAATPDGHGYWLVASDGGVSSYDAPFLGSMAVPVRGIAAAPDAGGYWLEAVDGGGFAFGDAPFVGSPVGTLSSRPLVSMAAASDGEGYRLAMIDASVDKRGLDSGLRTHWQGIVSTKGLSPSPRSNWMTCSPRAD